MYNLSEGRDLVKQLGPKPNNNLLTKGIPSYDDGSAGARYSDQNEWEFFKEEKRPSLFRKTPGKDEERIMKGEGVEGFFIGNEIDKKNKIDESDFDLDSIKFDELPEIGGNFVEEVEQPELAVISEAASEPVIKKVGFWEKVKNFWKEKPLKKIGQKVKETLFYETGDDQTKIQKNLEFYKPLEKIAKTIVDKSVVVWNKVKEIYQEKPWIKFGQKIKGIIFNKKEREEFIDKCRGYFETRAKKRKELVTA